MKSRCRWEVRVEMSNDHLDTMMNYCLAVWDNDASSSTTVSLIGGLCSDQGKAKGMYIEKEDGR